MDLYTFEDIKPILALDLSDIDEYPDLKVIRDMVKAAFEVYTQRQFDTGTYSQTRILESMSTRTIALSHVPVSSITSITEDGVILDSSTYKISPAGVRFTSEKTEATFIVNYVGGLSATTEALKRAGIWQSVHEFRKKEHPGATVSRIDGGSFTEKGIVLLPDVMRMLDSMAHPLKGYGAI